MIRTEQISTEDSGAENAPQADPSLIELAGYELKSLLGSGGYGEVWKAIGPGGFPKAVKILHGLRDGEHAEAELKALNRMRELRHPFLLNIERVEVCNNRLIVVTELADGNLNERFTACQTKGQIGIPRDELLGYLRDAADALDFMYDEHGLQHLDIKPDNLLLQGNHIQLGDFGLAKDVSITNMSMINGFTPLYASPELFEGRPGRASDQYSLAIVYQTMLTGKPPFNGRTAAQLTSQHLRSQPDLTHLAPMDRPVIARALSKTPASRYANCQEMVADLLDRKQAGRQNDAPKRRSVQRSKNSELSGDTLSIGIREMTEAEPSKPAQDLCVDEPAHRLRPTLIISVGGIGGRVLRHVKNSWANSSELDIPSWKVLAIDTDSNSLCSVDGLWSTGQLTDIEALPIKLRSSKDYRRAQNLDMSWLSRRWLFNIPRSVQVEGMRPLARLAVQDHCEAIRIRIRDRIKAVIEPDSIAESATAASTPFTENSLDVFIVSATSGGTGSGAVGDVALIVRELLAEFPGLESKVSGILLHGSGRQQRVDGIQTANTIACLKELRLLGMNGMGIPKGFSAEAAELTPFDHTWLLHCGTDLNDAEYRQATESVATFLFNATATPAASQWRSWRDSTAASDEGEPLFRLLGISGVDSDVYAMAESEAASLATALMNRWRSSATPDERQSTVDTSQIKDVLTSLQLTAGTLPERVLLELRGDAGSQIERLAETVYKRVLDAASSGSPHARLSQELSDQQQGSGGALLKGIQANVRRGLNRDHQTAESRIRHVLMKFMEIGTAAATIAVETVMAELTTTRNCCRQLSTEVDEAFRELRSQTSDTSVTGTSANHERLHEISRQYCALAGSQAIYEAFDRYIQDVFASLDTITSDQSNVCMKISQISKNLAAASSVHDGIPGPVVEAFHNYLASEKTIHIEALTASDFDPQSFANQLIDRATGFLLTAGTGERTPKEAFPATSWPKLRGLGGKHRVLIWAPEGSDVERWKTRLASEFGDCVSAYTSSEHRVTAICEVEGISSARLLKHLQLIDRAGWEISERIHTRIDVQW
ncbi:MAG: tubulin-like doman-containing protein [Planctomycetaceae bacterium]